MLKGWTLIRFLVRVPNCFLQNLEQKSHSYIIFHMGGEGMDYQKIEDKLAQLIRMVGSIQKDQQEMKQEIREMKQEICEMKQEIQGIKQEQSEMKQEIQTIKGEQQSMKEDLQEIRGLTQRVEELDAKEERRHREVLKRFKSIEIDQDFIWEKTSQNERDIANIKKQLA